MRIFIIEDEKKLSGLIQAAFAKVGWQSEVCETLEDAEHSLKSFHYDAVVLDLGLPDGRGEDLLASQRRAGNQKPILILTADGRIENRVDCLNAGADDYLTKPFDMEELIARIRALLRRPGGSLGSLITVGDVEVDTIGRQVTINSKNTTLSRQTLNVLENLIRRAGRVVPKEILEDAIYSDATWPESNPIPVHIHSLRKLLAETNSNVRITTVRGLGYILDKRSAEDET